MASRPIAFAAGSVARGREVLAAVAADFRARREPSPPVRETYFDTFDWSIHAQGGTLSATAERGGALLCRRATDGALLHRLLVAGEPAFVRDLPASPLRDELVAAAGHRQLLRVLRVETRRAVLRLEDEQDKTVARLVLEHGTAADPERGGKRRLPPTLQIVPVRGYEASATRLSRFLHEDRGLTPVEPCRFERALAATGRAPGGGHSKVRLGFDPEEAAAGALKRVLRVLFDTMRLNVDGLRRDVDTEFLHDFRVAVRRTRSALGQVKHVFPGSALARFRDEFDWLGAATNRLRDLDVHLLDLHDHRASLPAGEHRGLVTVESALQRAREIEHGLLVAVLDSERYATLLHEWEGFLAAPVPASGGDDVRNAHRSIRKVATGRIRRAHRRVIDHGRSIDAASPAEELHRLRIDCKRLRYLIEFFASLFEAEAVARLVKALKRLQDNLGSLHDLAVQRETLGGLADELTARDDSGEAGRAIESLLARLESRERQERERFRPCFESFDRSEVAGRLRRELGGTETGTS